jgi:MFS family permease
MAWHLETKTGADPRLNAPAVRNTRASPRRGRSDAAARSLADWGWRIGFLVGGLLGLLGFRLRRALEETPAFAQMQRRVARLPLREVIAAHPWPVLAGIASTAATAGFTGLLFVHMRGYLVAVLHYDAGRVAIALNVAIAAASFGLLAVGWLGDHVPRRGLLAASAALLLVGCWPWYMAAVGHTAPPIVLLVLAAVGASFASGVFGAVMADLFPTRVRYTGVALAYNVSFTLQRHRSAAGHCCHLRYGLGSGAGPGDGQ